MPNLKPKINPTSYEGVFKHILKNDRTKVRNPAPMIRAMIEKLNNIHNVVQEIKDQLDGS